MSLDKKENHSPPAGPRDLYRRHGMHETIRLILDIATKVVFPNAKSRRSFHIRAWDRIHFGNHLSVGAVAGNLAHSRFESNTWERV